MRRAATIALAVVLIVGIGLLDYLTPADVEFGLLYMLPVILVSWFVGLRTGLLFALAAMLAEAALDAALRPTVLAVAAWNGLSRLAVLAALATITDRMRQEREHWKAIDAERNTLLRLLEREFPRPLRALEWFSRTFVDTLGDSASEQVRRHFAALRHHIREVAFLATDVLAVGHLHSGKLRFERALLDVKRVTDEAANETVDRHRIILSLASEPLLMIGDADRIRHALSSILGRCLDASRDDPIPVLVRASGDDAAIEITCRGRSLGAEDLELAELLVVANGGRLNLRALGSGLGSVVTLTLPCERPSPSGAQGPAVPSASDRGG
jgi:signal transduction histidine kinase